MRYCYHRLGGLFHVDRASSPPPQPSLAHLVILIAIALISGFKNLIRVLFFLCVGADVISGVCFSLLLFSPLLFSFLLFSSLLFSSCSTLRSSPFSSSLLVCWVLFRFVCVFSGFGRLLFPLSSPCFSQVIPAHIQGTGKRGSGTWHAWGVFCTVERGVVFLFCFPGRGIFLSLC